MHSAQRNMYSIMKCIQHLHLFVYVWIYLHIHSYKCLSRPSNALELFVNNRQLQEFSTARHPVELFIVLRTFLISFSLLYRKIRVLRYIYFLALVPGLDIGHYSRLFQNFALKTNIHWWVHFQFKCKRLLKRKARYVRV